MTEPTPDPDPKPAEIVPPADPLRWNAADAKSLIITVVGTVLGGMALVLVLGVAILIARALRGSDPDPLTWIVIVSLPVLGLYSILSAYSARKKTRDKIGKDLYGKTLLVLVILELLYLLVWVGLLAGVK